MPVNKLGLICISSVPGVPGTTETFNIYQYSTNDAAAVVEADGYFDGILDNGLKKGDIIFASMVRSGSVVSKSYTVTAGGADVALVAF